MGDSCFRISRTNDSRGSAKGGKEAFEGLAQLHEVEATPVATFTDTGYFHVKHGEETVAYLPITFLHDGVPQLELESEWIPQNTNLSSLQRY